MDHHHTKQQEKLITNWSFLGRKGFRFLQEEYKTEGPAAAAAPDHMFMSKRTEVK